MISLSASIIEGHEVQELQRGGNLPQHHGSHLDRTRYPGPLYSGLSRLQEGSAAGGRG